jgi:hypothetical protein
MGNSVHAMSSHFYFYFFRESLIHDITMDHYCYVLSIGIVIVFTLFILAGSHICHPTVVAVMVFKWLLEGGGGGEGGSFMMASLSLPHSLM